MQFGDIVTSLLGSGPVSGGSYALHQRHSLALGPHESEGVRISAEILSGLPGCLR